MFMLITDSPWQFLTRLSENNNSIKKVKEQAKRQAKRAKPDISYEGEAGMSKQESRTLLTLTGTALDVMTAMFNEDVSKRPTAYGTATNAPVRRKLKFLFYDRVM